MHLHFESAKFSVHKSAFTCKIFLQFFAMKNAIIGICPRFSFAKYRCSGLCLAISIQLKKKTRNGACRLTLQKKCFFGILTDSAISGQLLP